MLTEKDYCDYDTWSALKELGCDIPRRLIPDYFGVLHEPQFEETLHLYDAQKWLREEKRICMRIFSRILNGKSIKDILTRSIWYDRIYSYRLCWIHRRSGV